MIVQPRIVTLKDGRPCTLRAPRPSDAAGLLAYLKTTANETEFLTRYPDEFTMNEEEEARIIERLLAAPRDVMLLADVEGEIAGNASFFANGSKSRCRHRCTLGIALYKKYWDMGIGTAMLEYLLLKATQLGFEQMELEVRARNVRAIALYEKMGFVKIGRLPNAAKHRDGTYDDDFMMIRRLI